MMLALRVLLGVILVSGSGVAANAPAGVSRGLCQVPTPTGGQLRSVVAISARDVWAVGTCSGSSSRQTLIEYWNGRVWRRVPSPDPGGLARLNELAGVAAVSARAAWAVGQSGAKGPDGSVQTLVVRWNGRAWRRVPSPNPLGLGGGSQNVLNAVAAVSASDAWAVGDVILRWNGSAWRQVPFPVLSPKNSSWMLNGVAATSPSNAWAVGWQRSAKDGWRTLIARWNGRSWRVAPSANPNPVPAALQQLVSVAAVSRSDAWTVGYSFDGQDQPQTLIEHWNGARWQIVASPDPAGLAASNALGAVAVAGPHLAWACGSYVSSALGSATLVLRWTGRRWKQVAAPSPGGNSDFDGISGLAVLSPSNAWAVGDNEDTVSGQLRTLILHWNGTAWKRISSP